MLHRAVVAGVTLAALVACALAAAAPASAYWYSGGEGAGTAASGSLAPPTLVAAVSGAQATVTVDWTGSAGLPEPDGYYVERTDADGSSPACGTGPTALQQSTSCTDGSVPPGLYAYTVTAVFRSWTARSAPSAAVTVAASLLGTAAAFSVLGTAVTTTGFTQVSGDLGTTPGTAVVGFPDGVVAGDIHAGDPTAAAAEADRAAAYAYLVGLVPDAVLSGDLIGQVLAPGVYSAGAALGLTGILTLDGGGDPGAVFVFQVGAAVTTAAGSSMLLVNGAQAANVYWVVNAAVSTGALSSFSGTILSSGAITLGAGALLIGRALSADAVTMADNVVRFTEALPPVLLIDGGPSGVTKDTSPVISGTTTALPDQIVTVSVGGQVLTAPVLSDGSWSVVAADLLAGTYAVVAKVKDAAGNGATAAQGLVVEVNPPTVELGAAAPFSLLAGTTISATGLSTAEGDVGVSPGTSITGLPPTSVGGTIHAGDAAAATALADLGTAIDDASGRLAHTEFSGDLVGQVFHAGVHHSATGLALTGTMTLDAEGDPDAVFIFQLDAAMGTAASSSVVLANGARASNVFWVVGAAVNTGALSTLPGSILATGTITLGAGTQLAGRALTLGAIVMAGTTVAAPQ